MNSLGNGYKQWFANITIAPLGAEVIPLTIGNKAVTGALSASVKNTSTVNNDTAGLGLSAGTSSVSILAANQNQAAALVTGGPTTAQAVLTAVGAIPLVIATTNTQRILIAAAGNVTISNPSSGVPLTVTGVVNGANIASITDGTITLGMFTATGLAALGATTNHPLSIVTNAITRISIAASGTVTVNAPTAGTALAVTALADQAGFSVTAGINTANTFLARVIGGTVAGKSSGLYIQAGTNASDAPLTVRDSTGGTNYLLVKGDGTISGGPNTTDCTPDTGTFTGTFTGFTANPTGTVTWVRIGPLVLVTFPTFAATSNATSLTMTGLPAAIRPATLTQAVPLNACSMEDNSSVLAPTQDSDCLVTAASGTLTFRKNGLAAGWTAAGTKGMLDKVTIYYQLT